jgi:hypothetical protein
LALFPIESPPLDKGLNLQDPTIHNGLSGTMQRVGESVDNYQALQYQDDSVTIGSCAACHSSSKPEGGDVEAFREKHAGTNPERRSACAVCHTALPAVMSSDY